MLCVKVSFRMIVQCKESGSMAVGCMNWTRRLGRQVCDSLLAQGTRSTVVGAHEMGSNMWI